MKIEQISGMEKQETLIQQDTRNQLSQTEKNSDILENINTPDEDAALVTTVTKAGAGNGEAFSVTELLENNDSLDRLNKNMASVIQNDPDTVFPSLDPDSMIYKLFSIGLPSVSTSTKEGMEGWRLSHLAYMDSNGDGCISSEEQEAESDTFIRGTISFSADGSPAKCMGEFRTEHYGITTINGQKVYALSTWGYAGIVKSDEKYKAYDVCESISLTETELSKLAEYYAKNGENADINGALAAMGIKGETKTINGKECLCFTGGSGVESVIFKSNGFKNTRSIEPSYSNALWCAYHAMKQPEFETQKTKGLTGTFFEEELAKQGITL